MRSFPVTHMMVGKAEPFRDGENSAIAKYPVEGPIAIDMPGLKGDEQADRKHHGGPHMAVHLYPLDHHDFWRATIGDHPLLVEPGAFGGNLAVEGITENDVHIGDRFRLGTALLEISQPRKPCWKIEHRFGQKDMVANILKTGHCGWYFRVVDDGCAQAGDAMIRERLGDAEWTVARAFDAIWAKPKKFTPDEIDDLVNCEALTPDLRTKLSARHA